MSNRNKRRSQPSIPAQTLLRIRLDQLWQEANLPGQTPEQIEAGLSAITSGLKRDVIVATVLAAFAAAAPPVRQQLEPVLPGWLERHDCAAILETLTAGGRLAKPLQPVAERWLAALGRNLEATPADPAGTFYSAYEFDDGSQAAVSLLSYSNRHRNRVQGFQFLIDYNPPWDGAIKDAFLLPIKPPQALLQRLTDMWDQRGQSLAPIGPAEVKRKLIQALLRNQAAGIRLPKDLIRLREPFVEHVLSLPDAPDTPVFTSDDFDALSHNGRAPEEISRFEHSVGRRIRLENGQELFIDANVANRGLDWLGDDQ